MTMLLCALCTCLRLCCVLAGISTGNLAGVKQVKADIRLQKESLMSAFQGCDVTRLAGTDFSHTSTGDALLTAWVGAHSKPRLAVAIMEVVVVVVACVCVCV